MRPLATVLAWSEVVHWPTKTAEPFEMLFELWSRLGPENRALGGDLVARGKGLF